VSAEPTGGQGINSANYRLTLAGCDEPVHLKVIEQAEASVADKLAALDGCFRSGVKTAEVLRTVDGKLSLEQDNCLLAVFRWCEGQPYGGRSAQRIAAGRELGRMNAALGGLGTTISRPVRYRPLSPEEVERIRAACTHSDEFDRKVLREIGRLGDLAAELDDRCPEAVALQHMDYHPANVLFDGDEVLAVLDVDSIVTERASQSVAFGCSRFGGDAEEMAEFLCGYRDGGSPVSAELIEQLPLLVCREALGRINYILRSAFFESDRRWCFDFGKHLATIDSVGSAAGELAGRLATLVN